MSKSSDDKRFADSRFPHTGIDARMVAWSRELLAHSEALLRRPAPTVFLGGGPYKPWPKAEGE